MIMMVRNRLIILVSLVFLTHCSISPGMHMKTSKALGSNQESVYIEELQQDIFIKNISEFQEEEIFSNQPYRIGNGDEVSITVWGLNDIFPVAGINPEQNLRRVDSNGNIFFPYAGIVKASDKTQNELREHLSNLLSEYFNEPQLDISIAKFNSQKVYLLGEVTQPSKINITDIPISLSDAIGEVKGINTVTGDGYNVFVIRIGSKNGIPEIFRADLSSPAGFLTAGKFYLKNNDIVYVNAKSTARWNKVISQFFPFSSFLNSVDNLTRD